jgi:flagellar motor protein MotB
MSDARALVVRAAEATAASGQYDVAVWLLARSGDDRDAQHIRAKIAAQQQRYGEAAAIWSALLKATPDDREAAQGRHLAERLAQRGAWFRFVANRSYLAGAAAIGVLAISVAATWLGQTRTAPVAPTNAPPSAPAVVDRSSAPSPAVARFQLAGVTQDEVGRGVAIVFDDGAFERNVRLRPSARETLQSLARQLRALSDKPVVRVTGYTDDLPVPEGRRYRDNAELALARAAIVADYLRLESALPASVFSASGADDGAAAPHATSEPADRLRNRTVRIVVTAGR